MIQSSRRTKVPLGILLVYYSFILVCVLILLMAATPLALASKPDLALSVLGLIAIVALGANIANFVGTALCLTAPDSMPGKGVIFLTVACNVLSTAIRAAGFLVTLPGIVDGLTTPIDIIGYGCFLMFLKHLGAYVDDTRLANDAEDLIFWIGSLVALCVLLLVLPLAISHFEVFAAIAALAIPLLGLLALVVGALAAIRYGRLLQGFTLALAED